MQESQTTTEFARWGIASDNTTVYVEEEEYQRADPDQRDNPDFWLEQLADNPAVWTVRDAFTKER